MATPTTKGSSWLKASIAAPISFRKQRLIFAASSDDNGGERRVFEKPFRGVFIMIPIAHLSVTAGFRPGNSQYLMFHCAYMDNVSRYVSKSARSLSESNCENRLFPDCHFF